MDGASTRHASVSSVAASIGIGHQHGQSVSTRQFKHLRRSTRSPKRKTPAEARLREAARSSALPDDAPRIAPRKAPLEFLQEAARRFRARADLARVTGIRRVGRIVRHYAQIALNSLV